MSEGEYFSARTPDAAERERLRALENANDPKSRRHFEDLGVGPGWNYLDVGGGGGSITCWLAGRVAPDGRVVAADIDTRFLQEIKLPNVEIRKLDILRDPVEDSMYALVHCRFLLMHLPDPELAVKRLINAARPGGWVMIEEPDFISYRAANPNHPLSEVFTRKVQETFANAERSGLFDPYFGRRTRDLLERAGLSEVASEGKAYLWHGGETEAIEHRLSLPALVKAGVCSEEDSLEIQKILDDPEFTIVGHTVFAAWGKRVA